MFHDGTVRFGNSLWVQDNPELKLDFMKEVHASKLAIYPGSIKMYQNLRL